MGIATPKISIVVPTYKRAKYAIRIINYLCNKDFRVYILDGSPVGLSSEELPGEANNINYFHLPISFQERMKYVSKIIKTPYVVMLGDDEFFLPSGLIKCAQYLDQYPDYIACMGRCMGFNVEKGRLIGWSGYREMCGYALSHNDPLERLIFHMDNYACSTIYAVARTENWVKAMQLIGKSSFSFSSYDEFLFEISMALQGKSIVIPALMWLRSFEATPIRELESSIHPAETISNWWSAYHYRNEKEQYLNLVASEHKHIGEHSKIVKALQEAIEKFISKQSYKGMKKTYRLKLFIWNLFPHSIKEIFKRSIFKILKIESKLSFSDMSNHFVRQNISVERSELLQIQKIIQQFHELKL